VAVILAVADIVDLALVRGDNESDGDDEEHENRRNDQQLFHGEPPSEWMMMAQL
jgi:hypothetical protein